MNSHMRRIRFLLFCQLCSIHCPGVEPITVDVDTVRMVEGDPPTTEDGVGSGSLGWEKTQWSQARNTK